MGHTAERIGGAGKALSGPEGGCATFLSEKQEVLVDMVVSKRDMPKEVPKKYQEKIFEGLRSFVQKKHTLTK